jgi:hypothetical protein
MLQGTGFLPDRERSVRREIAGVDLRSDLVGLEIENPFKGDTDAIELASDMIGALGQ